MSFLHGASFKLLPVAQAIRPLISARISTSCTHFLPAKQSVEEKLGFKPKPKRPLTTFLRFSVKIKPSLVEKYPNAEVKEITKMAAEEWKKVDEKEKAQLQEEFRKDWIKYQVAVKEYDKTLSPGDRDEIKSFKREQKINKEKKILKKKEEELGKPKRPPTSFVLFLMSKTHERGEMPYKEWQQKIAHEWENFPQGEKDKYAEAHKKEMETYKTKLADWEKTQGTKLGEKPKPVSRRAEETMSQKEEADEPRAQKTDTKRTLETEIGPQSNNKVAKYIFFALLTGLTLYFLRLTFII